MQTQEQILKYNSLGITDTQQLVFIFHREPGNLDSLSLLLSLLPLSEYLTLASPWSLFICRILVMRDFPLLKNFREKKLNNNRKEWSLACTGQTGSFSFCAVQVQHRKVTRVFPSDFNGSDYFINRINTTIYRSNFSFLVEVF